MPKSGDHAGDKTDETVAIPPSARCVLVVEPYMPLRTALCDCLAELGHETLAAATVDDALGLAASTVVDVVIADYDPNDEQRRQVVEDLKAADPDLPLVLLSPSEDPTGLADGSIVLDRTATLDMLDAAVTALPRRSRS